MLVKSLRISVNLITIRKRDSIQGIIAVLYYIVMFSLQNTILENLAGFGSYWKSFGNFFDYFGSSSTFLVLESRIVRMIELGSHIWPNTGIKLPIRVVFVTISESTIILAFYPMSCAGTLLIDLAQLRYCRQKKYEAFVR